MHSNLKANNGSFTKGETALLHVLMRHHPSFNSSFSVHQCHQCVFLCHRCIAPLIVASKVSFQGGSEVGRFLTLHKVAGVLQMLPHTVPEWVENTPAVMSDGSLWLGSRHTHAFFLDPKTGRLMKSFVEYGEGFPEVTSGSDGQPRQTIDQLLCI